jgi:hypothetical protein
MLSAPWSPEKRRTSDALLPANSSFPTLPQKRKWYYPILITHGLLENPSFIDDFPSDKPPFSSGIFQFAMFDCRPGCLAGFANLHPVSPLWRTSQDCLWDVKQAWMMTGTFTNTYIIFIKYNIHMYIRSKRIQIYIYVYLCIYIHIQLFVHVFLFL